MERNITPHRSIIGKKDRQRLNGHKSAILWFTGLSGSGKSTLAHNLERTLFERGVRTYVMDGDNIRSGLNKDLGFSREDRRENIRRIGEVARLFVDAGILVLTAFISPYKKERALVRNLVRKGEFLEIYIRCPLEICKKRDVKGLYKKASQGRITQFTGIDDPYEEPENPDLTIDTDSIDVHHSIEQIIKLLKKKKIIK